MKKTTETATTDATAGEIQIKPRLVNEAEQYSTWMGTKEGKIVYLLVLHRVLIGGELAHYELLRLFDPEITEVDPVLMSDMIADGRIKRWNR